MSSKDNDYMYKLRILKLLTDYLNRRSSKELTSKDIRFRQIRKKIKLQNIINKLGINRSIKIRKDSRERYIDKSEKCLNRLAKSQDRGAHKFTDIISHRARMHRIISLTIKKNRKKYIV